MYLLWERFPHEEATLLKVCSSYEIARDTMEKRKIEKADRYANDRYYYDIDEVEMDVDLDL